MLGLLVVVHELGHFIVARLAGVRVLEFGIGFPPRAKVLRSEGETALHAQLAAARRVRPARGRGRRIGRPALVRPGALPVKLVILVAGVAMNVLLAVAIFSAIAWLPGRTAALGFADGPAGVAGGRPSGSPAAEPGAPESSDLIVAVDGAALPRLRGRPAPPGGAIRCPGVDEQITAGAQHPCHLIREPPEIEVMHRVERGHEIDRPIRQGEPLGLAPQRHPRPAPAAGEHGVTAIGGQHPRPLRENSTQQLRVTTGTGPNIDAQYGLVRKSITYEQHRIVIRLSKSFVTGRNALEVLLGRLPLPRGVRARQGAVQVSHSAEPIRAPRVRRMVRRRDPTRPLTPRSVSSVTIGRAVPTRSSPASMPGRECMAKAAVHQRRPQP